MALAAGCMHHEHNEEVHGTGSSSLPLDKYLLRLYGGQWNQLPALVPVTPTHKASGTRYGQVNFRVRVTSAPTQKGNMQSRATCNEYFYACVDHQTAEHRLLITKKINYIGVTEMGCYILTPSSIKMNQNSSRKWYVLDIAKLFLVVSCTHDFELATSRHVLKYVA